MKHGIEVAWITVREMIDGFFALLPNIVIAVLVFFAFFVLSRVASRVALAMANRASMDRTLARALGRLVAVFTIILGILVCAVIVVPSFSLGKVIAGLGITSVAIGFAFQNILQNFFAGLLLLWQKPFGIGDEIKARDFEGTVEDITIRTTLLKTFNGELIYVPNGLLFTDPVTVYTAYSSRKVHIEIPIEDKDRVNAVEIASSTLKSFPWVVKDPEPQAFISAAAGKLKLDVYFWADSRSSQRIQATSEATYAIQEALKRSSSSAKAA